MFPDLKELLFSFNARSVKYLVVGGYAVSLHAQPRSTQDIDILISCDEANSLAIYAALKDFGAPMEGISPIDFAVSGKFFRMGHSPVAVDILSEIDGLSFEQAWPNRIEATIDTDAGLKAYFISREDLIVNKLASGRAQDLADVDALRKAAKLEK